MNIEHLHLFTEIKDWKPKNGCHYVVIDNMVMGHAWHSESIGNWTIWPKVDGNITHVLDLSKLTTKEEAESNFILGSRMMSADNEEPKTVTCHHSGEVFKVGDMCYYVNSGFLDIYPLEGIIDENEENGCNTRLAYFHAEQDAIDWNLKRFGK